MTEKRGIRGSVAGGLRGALLEGRLALSAMETHFPARLRTNNTFVGRTTRAERDGNLSRRQWAVGEFPRRSWKDDSR